MTPAPRDPATRGAPPAPPAEFLRFAARHRLIVPGSRVIAAVSGGADSMGLLHLLLSARERLGIAVEVAHFDHRLRGRASAADAAFVRAEARRLGLPFHLGRGRAFTAAERRARSVQELARERRLGFLLRLARRRGAVVALGHTADDQAETVLMRLIAGGGPPGLAGIPPSSHGGVLIHPLLGLRRAALRAWVGACGVSHREDPSNRSARYLRNRVRMRLLPGIARDYNPRIVERLGTVATLLRRDNERLEAEAAALLGRAGTVEGGIRFSARMLSGAHPAVLSRAVLAAARRLASPGSEITSAHLESLLADGAGSRDYDLPGGLKARRDRTGLALTVRRAAAAPRRAAVRLPLPGRVGFGGGRLSAQTVAVPRNFDPRRFAADGRRVALDRDRIRPPLLVRGRLPGDRFHPFGLPAPKKLKEFLIDARVPAAQRDRLALVCDREGILWVAGLRPAERCRVTPSTRRLLLLALEDGPGRPPATSDGGGAAPPRLSPPPAGRRGRRGEAASASARRAARGRRRPRPA